jgi:hypothetical protein
MALTATAESTQLVKAGSIGAGLVFREIGAQTSRQIERETKELGRKRTLELQLVEAAGGRIQGVAQGFV